VLRLVGDRKDRFSFVLDFCFHVEMGLCRSSGFIDEMSNGIVHKYKRGNVRFLAFRCRPTSKREREREEITLENRIKRKRDGIEKTPLRKREENFVEHPFLIEMKMDGQ